MTSLGKTCAADLQVGSVFCYNRTSGDSTLFLKKENLLYLEGKKAIILLDKKVLRDNELELEVLHATQGHGKILTSFYNTAYYSVFVDLA